MKVTILLNRNDVHYLKQCSNYEFMDAGSKCENIMNKIQKAIKKSTKKCFDCKGKGYHESNNQISICDCKSGGQK